MSADRWQQMRELFDAVCERPEPEWRPALEALTTDAALVQETLGLLGAQTVQFAGLSGPLDALIAQAAGPELLPGDRLGPWRLTRHLATGGMGTVYLAERADDLYRQEVAVKLLRGLADPFTAQRLAAERQILATLQHPNIAHLYDGGTTPAGQPYLVMEYVDGLALDAYCREHALDLGARLQLLLRIGRAVQAAHERLVVHCDLKPSNVLVRADGEPSLLDFGIARMVDAADPAERAGFCTLPYASPELLQGQGVTVGVGTDVFSLGVMLVELLADRPVVRTLRDRDAPIPLPSVHAPAALPWRRQLRGDLDAIAARACAMDPAARYASVADFMRDLQRSLDHYPVEARPATRTYRASRLLRRRWRETAALLAVLVLTAGFMWRLKEARDTSVQEAATAERVSEFLVSAFDAADPRKRGARGTETISARAILDTSAARLDDEMASAPAMQARLRAVLGRAYRNLEDEKQAEVMLRRAAGELLAPAVNRPVDAARTLSELSVLLSNSDRGTEAVATAQRALELAEHARDGSAQADALNSLGLAYINTNEYPLAQARLETALALRRQMAKTDPREKGTIGPTLHNLAQLQRTMGHYADAERLYRESLAMKASLTGTRTVDYWYGVNGLAQSLAQQGKLAESAAVMEENLALAQALYGEGYAVASSHNELANAYQDMGDYTRAGQHYRAALAVDANIHDEDSVSHARYLNNLATLEESRGDMAAAERLYRASLAIRIARLGLDAPLTANAQSNLGALLVRMGRQEEGRPLLEHAYAVSASQFPPDHPKRLPQRLFQAEWAMRRGELAAAREALAAVRPAAGWPSPQLARRHDGLLADLDYRSGDYAAAAREWAVLLKQDEDEAGVSMVSTAVTRVPLAESLLAVGDAAGARTQAALAGPILRAQLAPGAEVLGRLERVEARLAAGGGRSVAPAASLRPSSVRMR